MNDTMCVIFISSKSYHGIVRVCFKVMLNVVMIQRWRVQTPTHVRVCSFGIDVHVCTTSPYM